VAEEWVEREVIRLRDRLHEIANDLTQVRLSEGSHDRDLVRLSTDVADFEGRLQKVEDRVAVMSHKDEIADAVAARLDLERGFVREQRFTRWQVWGIRVAIGSAVLGGIAEIVRVAAALHA
jgi:hypothetical protein